MWSSATPFELGGSVADSLLALSYAVLVGIGIAQSYVDIRTHLVYVTVTRVALWWTIAALGLHAVIVGEWEGVVRASVSALVLWIGFRLIARGSAGGLGTGDVRLAPVIGMALGYLSYGTLVAGVVAMTAIGAIWALIAMLRSGLHARVPYVPAMYGGLVVALVTH